MKDLQELLARLLGETDAIWLPLRSWRRPVPGNTYEARVAFRRSGGISWASGGRSERARKAAQRLLEELAAAGSIIVTRSRQVRTDLVLLAPDAEADTRQLCGLPGMYSGWLSAREVARHSKRPGEAALMTDVWIDEVQLSGSPDKRERMLTEELLLPALAAGYVDARADARGLVYYAVTRAGWAWLNAGAAPPDDEDGPCDEDARQTYHAALRAALSRLSTAAPAVPGELGYLPLPAGGGPLEMWCEPS
ncbi:MAG: hypothetical protein IPM18_00130 [Phycisphaerales bacterium]|nr:hypothetical protein [Phycisphaerales bacterium]